jgi:hypothetical protein
MGRRRQDQTRRAGDWAQTAHQKQIDVSWQDMRLGREDERWANAIVTK